MKLRIPFHRRSIRYAATILLSALFCVIGLMALRYSQPDEEGVFSIATAENQELLFFGQGEDQVFLVLRDGEETNLHCLDLASGETVMAGLKKEPDRFFLSGDTLGIISRDSMSYSLLFWNSRIEISDAQQNALQYFADSVSNDSFTAFSDSLLYIAPPGGCLEIYSPFEFSPEEAGLDGIRFLASTPAGQVYAYSDETLFSWIGGDFGNRAQWSYIFSPIQLIGESAFLDEDGTAYVLGEGGLEPLPEGLIMGDPFREYLSDDEIYSASSADTVYRYTFTGELTGSFSLDGEIKGLASGGALVKRENEFVFAPYYFTDIGTEPEETPSPEPDPTPEPSSEPDPSEEPSPSPEPEPASPEPTQEPEPSQEPTTEPDDSPTPDVPTSTPSPNPIYHTREVDGVEYILLSSPMTIKELRTLMAPEAVKIKDQEGNSAAEGILKTGMTMTRMNRQEVCIVIQGDCTGDGYINVKDMELGCYCILGASYIPTDAAFLAIDFDDDGRLTLLDLVNLSDAIGANR